MNRPGENNMVKPPHPPRIEPLFSATKIAAKALDQAAMRIENIAQQLDQGES